MNQTEQSQLQFAQIGCGLIGRKRAAALGKIPGAALRYACDTDPSRAAELAGAVPGCRTARDLAAVLADKAVGAVIVSTPNAALAPAALEAVRAGRHVLIEKPGALRAEQLRELQAEAKKSGALGSRQLQPPLPPGPAEGARARRRGCARETDVHTGPLRPRRTQGLRPGVEGGPRPLRRRRTHRPGRAPDRSRRLVSRGRSPSWKAMRTPSFGT